MQFACNIYSKQPKSRTEILGFDIVRNALLVRHPVACCKTFGRIGGGGGRKKETGGGGGQALTV
jgi:hypothetical protein